MSFYPLILLDDHLYKDGTDYHQKELFRAYRAREACGNPRGQKILDIGSYPGTAHEVFGVFNHYTAFGILYPDFIEALCNAGISYVEGDIQKHATQSDADVILFMEVIEHLNLPHEALKNLFLSAKSGAILYITTNNASYYGYILKLLFNKDIYHSIQTQSTAYPGHTRYFGLEELSLELEAVGFQVISKRYINFLPKSRYYRSRLFGVIKNLIGALVPKRYSSNIELVVKKP